MCSGSGAVAKGAQIDLVIAADTNDASGQILAVLRVIDYKPRSDH